MENKITQEDIQSLGWYLDQVTKDGADFYYGTMIDEIELRLHCHNGFLKFDYQNYSKIIITDMKTRKDIFNGTIQNKQDLEVLMNQLNII